MNASREFNRARILAMIEAKRGDGWEFSSSAPTWPRSMTRGPSAWTPTRA